MYIEVSPYLDIGTNRKANQSDIKDWHQQRTTFITQLLISWSFK